jgi:hypothetical protein
LDEVFPNSSASYSKTPTKLLRKASFPVEDVLKNSEPVNLIFPGAVKRPIPCPVQVTISCPPYSSAALLPSPYIAPRGLGVAQYVTVPVVSTPLYFPVAEKEVSIVGSPPSTSNTFDL